MKSKLIISILFVILLVILGGCQSPKEVIIHFDSNGGSLVDSVVYDDAFILPNPPELEGHTFSGWYYDQNQFLISFVSDEINIEELEDEITLYAKWQKNTYTITYAVMDDYNDLMQFPLAVDEQISKIELNSVHTALLTSKGRLFTWGNNYHGSLGDGTNINRMYPTQITHWFPLDKEDIIVDISTGDRHTAAITASGRLFMWGGNEFGQLGDGTTNPKNTPTDITSHLNLENNETVIDVELGLFHSAILTSKGRMLLWGYNQNGQIGDETQTNRPFAYDITSHLNLGPTEVIKQMSLGYSHSAIITSKNRLITWGDNSFGENPQGSLSAYYSPRDVTTNLLLNENEQLDKIDLGQSHGLLLTSFGRVFTWGDNRFGQLGNETNMRTIDLIDITYKLKLQPTVYVKDITAGSDHSGVLTSLGTIYTWGYNPSGALGNDTIISSNLPQEIDVLDLSENEVPQSLSFGGNASMMMTSKGQLYVWGETRWGQLGQLIGENSKIPSRNEHFIHAYVVNEEIHSFNDNLLEVDYTKDGYYLDHWFLDSEQTHLFDEQKMPGEDLILYGRWHLIKYQVKFAPVTGMNNPNYIGTYTIETPTIILEDPSLLGHDFYGWFKEDDTLNLELITAIEQGSMGDITLYPNFVPHRYDVLYLGVNDTSDKFKIALLPNETIKEVEVNDTIVALLTDQGRLMVWGSNDNYLFTEISIDSLATPYQISNRFPLNENEYIIDVDLGSDFAVVLTSDGRLFVWGNKSVYTSYPYADTTFIPVELLTDFNLMNGEKIEQFETGSNHAAFVTSNHRMFVWGINTEGQLGLGHKNYQGIPTDITNQFELNEDEFIKQISLGDKHSAMLTSNGRVFTWGYNLYGQLGNGYQADLVIPKDITGNFYLNEDDKITSIKMKQNSSSAITTQGNVYIWGINQYGQVGNNTVTYVSKPYKISHSYDIINYDISGTHSMFLSTQNQIFAWGYNASGQLDTYPSTYVKVPTETTDLFKLIDDEITHITLGNQFSFIVSEKGLVWMWGDNQNHRVLNNSSTGKIGLDSKWVISDTTVIHESVTYYGTYLGNYIPTKEGYTFDGWYLDENFVVPLDWNTIYNKNLVLYARWK